MPINWTCGHSLRTAIKAIAWLQIGFSVVCIIACITYTIETEQPFLTIKENVTNQSLSNPSTGISGYSYEKDTRVSLNPAFIILLPTLVYFFAAFGLLFENNGIKRIILCQLWLVVNVIFTALMSLVFVLGFAGVLDLFNVISLLIVLPNVYSIFVVQQFIKELRGMQLQSNVHNPVES